MLVMVTGIRIANLFLTDRLLPGRFTVSRAYSMSYTLTCFRCAISSSE